VYATTGRSLLTDGRLTARELGRLDLRCRGGLFEVLPRAEDRIPELADALELRLVSADDFLDFHRANPWIPGDHERFRRPFPQPDGTVRSRQTGPAPTRRC
jgi:hypothetical protein